MFNLNLTVLLSSKYSYAGGLFLFSLSDLLKSAEVFEKLGIVGICFCVIAYLVWQDSKKQKRFEEQLQQHIAMTEKLMAEKDTIMSQRLEEKEIEIKDLRAEIKQLREELGKHKFN